MGNSAPFSHSDHPLKGGRVSEFSLSFIQTPDGKPLRLAFDDTSFTRVAMPEAAPLPLLGHEKTVRGRVRICL